MLRPQATHGARATERAKANATGEAQAAALASVMDRIEKMRADLWAPAERLRIAQPA